MTPSTTITKDMLDLAKHIVEVLVNVTVLEKPLGCPSGGAHAQGPRKTVASAARCCTCLRLPLLRRPIDVAEPRL
jgi:hypothetical protein